MRPTIFPDIPVSLERNTEVPSTTSSETLLPSCSRQKGPFPCFIWKRFPTFRSHLRIRPVSLRNSRRGLVGGATFRRTQMSQSALDKDPMAGHFFECNPVDEVATRRGSDTPVHRLEKPQVPNTAQQVACHPVNNSRGKWSSIPQHNTRRASSVPTLQRPCDRSQKWRGTLSFLPQLEMRPSSIAPNPVESREVPPNSIVSLTSHRHPEKLPEVPLPAQVEGTQGF